MKAIIHNIKSIVQKNYSLLDWIVCFMLATILSIAPIYHNIGHFDMKEFHVYQWLIFFIGFVFFWILARMIISQINNGTNMKLSWIEKLFQKKYKIFVIALMIFLCWLPILICLYPGTFANDTYTQLQQFYGLKNGGKISDHHPVLDTLIMGSVIVPLVKLTGNWHISMFLYVILQAIITSTTLAYSVVFAKEKLNLNNKAILFAIIAYAFLPIFPCSVQNINKDAIFVWIYILFFIKYIEIVMTQGESLNQKKNIVIISILSIFCALTKKVGMYVILGSWIVLLCFKIKNRIKLLIPISSVIVIMIGVLPILFQMFNVIEGSPKEKFSLLFQQTANYIVYHREEIKGEEKEIIEKVIGEDFDRIATVYNPTFADPIKNYDLASENLPYGKYIKVWFKQGLRHPRAYIDATISMWSGWFYIYKYQPLLDMDWHNRLDPNVIAESVTEREGIFQKLSQFIKDSYEKLYQIPIIGVFVSYGFYALLLPCFALTTCIQYRNKTKDWLVLVPLGLSIFFGCLLASSSGPIEGNRYLYPATFSSVMTILWTIYVMKKYNGS